MTQTRTEYAAKIVAYAANKLGTWKIGDIVPLSASTEKEALLAARFGIYADGYGVEILRREVTVTEWEPV